MNTFPILSRKPARTGFSDEQTGKAVLVADMASGYPILNKLFTFDPRTIKFDLRSLSNADKLTVIAFYEVNKDIIFLWTNVQDTTQYEACFIIQPKIRLDGRDDLWCITLELRLLKEI